MLLPKEVWRDIPGYEGRYQVSNIGNVRSLNYGGVKGKVKRMKPGTTGGEYKQVRLFKNNKRKHCMVHRLVALAFISNPNNLPEVNHIDENKTNNCVWNLEWCDRKYNMNYGSVQERISKAVAEHNSKASKGKKLSEETKRKISEARKEYWRKRKEGSL